MVKSGCIGMRRDHGDEKIENSASIQCLTMHPRCLHDSSTDQLRLMTEALRFTMVELRMFTMPPRFDTVLERFKPIALRLRHDLRRIARFSGCHVTVRQIMTPNIIISSTFDDVSHAFKKKSCTISPTPSPLVQHSLSNYYVHLCGISVQLKLQISNLKSLVRFT